MTENELILTSVRHCRRVDLYADSRPLDSREQDALERIHQRRREGEPLQYILGACEFFGLSFHVDAHVLVPRPETEILVEEVLAAVRRQARNEWRILDIGTGSGNIAVSLAKNITGARIKAIDISAGALRVALENSQKHGVARQIDFLREDMLDFLKKEEPAEKFDIIVSNPPYVSSSQIPRLSPEVQREPLSALDGGWDGLMFYEPIISASCSRLNPGGMLFLEIGDGQGAAIYKIFSHYPQFIDVQCRKDYAGADRVVSACLRVLRS